MKVNYNLNIFFDWKSPGGEFLPMFRETYPYYKCLQSKKYQDLIDELVNENLSVTSARLAFFLAKFDYDLWEISTGGDDYCLAIMPSSHRAQFKKEWRDNCESLTLVSPETATPTKSEKKKWIDQEHKFSEELFIQTHDNYFNGIISAFLMKDSKDKALRLVDFNQWPPCVEKISHIDSKKCHWEKHHLVYSDNDRKIWLINSDSFQFVSLNGLEFSKMSPQIHEPLSTRNILVIGNIIFSVASSFDATSGITHSKVLRITRHEVTTIFETKGSLEIMDVGLNRILISESNIMIGDWESTQFCIWNEKDKAQVNVLASFPTMPCQIQNALAYLGADEILYFSKIEQSVPETKSFKERILYAHRFNFITFKETSFALEGFCSETTYKAKMYNPGGKDLVVKSFEGNVSIDKGHGDCWIISYSSRMSGPKTLFWIWNQNTNEALKVTTKDIPKIDLQLFYSAKLNRYFSYSSEGAILYSIDLQKV